MGSFWFCMLLACLYICTYVLFLLPHRHDKRGVRRRKEKKRWINMRNKQNHCQSKIWVPSFPSKSFRTGRSYIFFAKGEIDTSAKYKFLRIMEDARAWRVFNRRHATFLDLEFFQNKCVNDFLGDYPKPLWHCYTRVKARVKPLPVSHKLVWLFLVRHLWENLARLKCIITLIKSFADDNI